MEARRTAANKCPELVPESTTHPPVYFVPPPSRLSSAHFRNGIPVIPEARICAHGHSRCDRHARARFLGQASRHTFGMEDETRLPYILRTDVRALVHYASIRITREVSDLGEFLGRLNDAQTSPGRIMELRDDSGYGGDNAGNWKRRAALLLKKTSPEGKRRCTAG